MGGGERQEDQNLQAIFSYIHSELKGSRGHLRRHLRQANKQTRNNTTTEPQTNTKSN